MVEGEEDRGRKPQPQQQQQQQQQQQPPKGFKKVVVGVCVMEKKVGEETEADALWRLSLWCGEGNFLSLLRFLSAGVEAPRFSAIGNANSRSTG
jgi:hypothetical protein